jgi:hypothetical protein
LLCVAVCALACNGAEAIVGSSNEAATNKIKTIGHVFRFIFSLKVFSLMSLFILLSPPYFQIFSLHLSLALLEEKLIVPIDACRKIERATSILCEFAVSALALLAVASETNESLPSRVLLNSV